MWPTSRLGVRGIKMKFRIVTTCEFKPEKVIEDYPCLNKFNFDDGYVTINSLEELMDLIKAVENEIIIEDNSIPQIEIYDSYRE